MTERALLVKSAFSADGRYAAVSVVHAETRVFDTTTGDLIGTAASPATKHAVASCVATFTLPGRVSPTVATGTADGRVVVYDVARAAVTFEGTVAEAGCAVVAVRHVAGTNIVAALSNSGAITLLDANAGTCVAYRLRTPVNRASALDIVRPSATAKTAIAVVASAAGCATVDVPLAGAVDGSVCEVRVAFAGHAAAPDYVEAFQSGDAAVTGTFTDGTLRLWDLRPAGALLGQKSASKGEDRCRATMLCGNRVLLCTVAADKRCIAATTVIGDVLLWRVDVASFVTQGQRNVTAPLPISARFVTAVGPGRILGAFAADDGALVLARGKWAVPAFERLSGADAEAAAQSCLRLGQLSAVKLPFTAPEDLRGPAEHAVANERKTVRKPRLATSTEVAGALATEARVPLAATVDALPVAFRPTVDAADGDDVVAVSGTGVLGPLHQALHAKDASLATELVMVAARSAAEVAATVSGLQLPYLVQLLQILARRVTVSPLASPVHAWLAAILAQRGGELAAAARVEDDLGASIRAVLAPVLAHYRAVAATHAAVAVVYGRSSVFKSTRPSRGKAAFLNNFEEPVKAGAVKCVRMSALGVVEDAASDGEDADAGRPTRRGRRATKNARMARRRIAAKQERMLADGADEDDDEAVLEGAPAKRNRLATLDDGASDEHGDDGSSAAEGDALGEEDEEDDDYDDEEDDESLGDDDIEDAFGSDGGNDDEGGAMMSGGDAGSAVDSVEYESGAEVEDDVDGAGFDKAQRQHRQRMHGRVNLNEDGSDGGSDDDG